MDCINVWGGGAGGEVKKRLCGGLDIESFLQCHEDIDGEKKKKRKVNGEMRSAETHSCENFLTSASSCRVTTIVPRQSQFFVASFLVNFGPIRFLTMTPSGHSEGPEVPGENASL